MKLLYLVLLVDTSSHYSLLIWSMESGKLFLEFLHTSDSDKDIISISQYSKLLTLSVHAQEGSSS